MKKILFSIADIKKLRGSLESAKKQSNYWNPQKAGEQIFGEVVSITKVKNKGGSKFKEKESTVCNLQTSEGEKKFYLKAVLKDRFKELSIKPKDKIAVEYLGAKMNGKKVEYHKYAVAKL